DPGRRRPPPCRAAPRERVRGELHRVPIRLEPRRLPRPGL
ncbi:MAG: hypothetical protein AVDCRST_MAG66-3771, partial [uncultured Pseudonocardia sp.]